MSTPVSAVAQVVACPHCRNDNLVEPNKTSVRCASCFREFNVLDADVGLEKVSAIVQKVKSSVGRRLRPMKTIKGILFEGPDAGIRLWQVRRIWKCLQLPAGRFYQGLGKAIEQEAVCFDEPSDRLFLPASVRTAMVESRPFWGVPLFTQALCFFWWFLAVVVVAVAGAIASVFATQLLN